MNHVVFSVKGRSSQISNHWINEKRLSLGRFEWQTGYGAFTIGQSQVERVVKYILNQEEHHSKKTFKEEYLDFLKAYEVDYNPDYVFDI